jgi:hypothetical protein
MNIMDIEKDKNKEGKGLTDNGQGDLVLNESGTSVSIDEGEAINTEDVDDSIQYKPDQEVTFTTEDPIMSNDIASDEESQQDEDIIKPFDDLFPEQKAYEDMDDISSTDDK